MSEFENIEMSEPIITEEEINQMDAEIEEELKTTVTVAIQTEVLQKAVANVERSVSKKAVQEIFYHIYMDFQEDKITLRAINSNFTTETIIVQNEDKSNFLITDGKPGSVCFLGNKLSDIVKKLKNKNTEIQIKAFNALIKSGKREFHLNGQDGTQFPRIPDLKATHSFSIHPDVLGKIYSKTAYAAAVKETMPIITGLHHKVVGNLLTVVATDKHRLAQHVYELDEDLGEFSKTIPLVTINEISKLLKTTEVEVILHFAETQVVFEFENTKVYSRVLQDVYPATDRMIPMETNSSVALPVGEFRDLLAGSTTFNADQPIIIRLKPELNQCRVTTREAQVGAFKEDICTLHGKGPDVQLAMNVRYLQEALNQYAPDEYIVFEFIDGRKPFKATLLNGDPLNLDLFVPVRTQELDNDEVVIDDFTGVSQEDFNPFAEALAELEA